jgi:hypothetical protein
VVDVDQSADDAGGGAVEPRSMEIVELEALG